VTQAPLLEVVEVSKRFPGVLALDQVSLRIETGEVLAIVGENGAGKSTLMKALAGIYRPDSGEVRLDGRAVRFTSAADALAVGINLIHQELNLAENLSVAANIFLGREKTWGGRLGFLDRGGMRIEARGLMARIGLDCPPDAPVSALPPGQRQLVEIARALSLKTRVLIMDEPTSSLTQRETERLFAVIGDLKRSGVAVVYISHRLPEIGRVADRVVVLRDGRRAGALDRADISHDAMVRLMVGRDLQQFFQHRTGAKADGAARLEVRGLRFVGGGATPVSFAVQRGEIVGMAGLVGAGRTELAEALFGIWPILAGQVLLDGAVARIHHPRDAVALGMLLVPEDRRFHGLVVEDTIQHNIGLPNLDRLSRLGLVGRGREAALAGEMCGRLHVRSRTIRQSVSLLSGGNQQKVVLGKWLARRPRVLIFDEPTRGIDVGAKSEIYALMSELAADGVAVLMISSDLEEVLGVSDRVLVLHEGRLAGDLRGADLNEETIMRLATGGGERR
jgi:ribose transport system ATP-binding protein